MDSRVRAMVVASLNAGVMVVSGGRLVGSWGARSARGHEEEKQKDVEDQGEAYEHYQERGGVVLADEGVGQVDGTYDDDDREERAHQEQEAFRSAARSQVGDGSGPRDLE